MKRYIANKTDRLTNVDIFDITNYFYECKTKRNNLNKTKISIILYASHCYDSKSNVFGLIAWGNDVLLA